MNLILRVGRKEKKRTGDICKGTLNIEFEQDWSFGIGAKLDYTMDTKLNKKTP